MNTTFRLSFVAVMSVLAVMACDSVPLTSPTGSTISLSIDKNILPLNGQATVRAVVMESGGTAVHNGTTVTFQPSIGRTDPVEAQTVNGIATVTFLAGGVSGTGFIHAFSGGARTGSGNSSAGGVEVRIGAAAAGSISLQVVPSSVSQNGGSVTITALVLDSANNPLAGVPVLFSTDQGTLSNSTVISDASGFATTRLDTTRPAKVTARVGSATPVTFDVGVSAAPTVTISAPTPNPATVGQPVSFTITPSTATGAAPIQSVLVDFGDGQQQQFSGITGPVGVTHIYNNSGGYTITATATDINGGRGVSSTAVVVNRQQLPTVSLTAPSSTTTTVATQITFSATPPTGAQIVSARVTLQDGTVIYSGTNASSFAYRFGGAGTYTLTGTVVDSNGNQASTSTQIVVNP